MRLGERHILQRVMAFKNSFNGFDPGFYPDPNRDLNNKIQAKIMTKSS